MFNHLRRSKDAHLLPNPDPQEDNAGNDRGGSHHDSADKGFSGGGGPLDYISAAMKAAQQKEQVEKERRKAHVERKLEFLGSELDQIQTQIEGANIKPKYIKIKVVKCKHLPSPHDKNLNCFVKISLGEKLKTTQSIKNEISPVFNETFIIVVRYTSLIPPLKVEVYDQDVLYAHSRDKDELLGSCEIPVDEFVGEDKPPYHVEQQLVIPAKVHRLGHLDEPTIELEIQQVSAAERKGLQNAGAGRRRGSAFLNPQVLERAVNHAGSLGLLPALDKKQMEMAGRGSDDNVRMILVGHIGKLRHGSSDIRRTALAQIGRTAGHRGKSLPKTGDWPAMLCKALSERVEKDTVSDVRLDALEVLGFVSQEGYRDATKTFARAMQDPVREVRLMAVNMLLRVVEKGNETAIVAVGRRLEDADHKVRIAACEALPKLSSPFDDRLVTEALQRLDNIHAVVRCIAAKALGSVTTRGAPVVIDGLFKAIRDPDAQVKMTGMQELANQVERGDVIAVQIVSEQLQDPRPAVRSTAANCLAKMSTGDKKEVLVNLLGGLSDPGKDNFGHMSVQTAALETLRTLAGAQDHHNSISPRTKNALLDAIEDKLSSNDWCVRKEALASIQVLSAHRGLKILKKVMHLLEDGHLEVRSQAIEAIRIMSAQTLGRTGSAEVTESGEILQNLAPDEVQTWLSCALAMRLVSPTAATRNAAAHLISEIHDPANIDEFSDWLLNGVKQGKLPANEEVARFLMTLGYRRGDRNVVDGFMEGLQHKHAEVRKMSNESIERYSLNGQESVIKELSRLLGHDSEEVRACAASAVSKVGRQNDENIIGLLNKLMDDESRTVRAAVPPALQNLLAEGDSRILVADSLLHLEPAYHNENERRQALTKLGQLAYANQNMKVQGWSVEDADLIGFWNAIRQPRGMQAENAKVLTKVLKRLRDEDTWVRRAAVEALRQSAEPGDQEVVQALVEMVNDASFAVRIAVVEAIMVLGKQDDRQVIDAVLSKLNDVSHLVRLSSVSALEHLVRLGDGESARSLMTWLETSWEYIRTRGNDTNVKTEVVKLLLHILGFRDEDRTERLLTALASPKLHYQRNAIADFDDFLVSQNLIKPYFEHRRQIQESKQAKTGATGISSGLKMSTNHLAAITLIQRFATKNILEPRKNARARQYLKARQGKSAFSEEKPKVRMGTSSMGLDLGGVGMPDHIMAEEDLAERILRRCVPTDVRSSAIATTHEKYKIPEEDIRLWDRMRWTERLRLCEEIAGKVYWL